ncbi:hypothetical protein B9T31_15970 [Acinetobacter sp. ANC 4558]|nr:hypothetical protein [Acinetobacter sp. ANC 4558]OTG80817.1 hypothetical protein B9T31_15970 [Acinetobacter sp. ANC 4558]
MRMSEDQLEAHLNKHQMRKNEGKQPDKTKNDARALGRLKRGEMNKTERNYAGYLESQKIRGEISYYAFDSIKFRLADKTFYSPDFIVMKANGELEAHEVKGHWEDDARVKIKVAASMHPIPFIAVYWNSKNNNWDFENF